MILLMNKKLLIILCVVISLMIMVACRNVSVPNGTTAPTSNGQLSVPSDSTEPEFVPGAVENPFDDATTPEATGEVITNTEPTTPSEPDKPTEPTAPTETETPTEPTVPSEPASTSFEQYNAMSPEEQYAFFCTFSSMEDFVAWYNNAKAEYEAAHPGIDIGDGNIDIGDIIGGNP